MKLPHSWANSDGIYAVSRRARSLQTGLSGVRYSGKDMGPGLLR